jgi:hypothetical protein
METMVSIAKDANPSSSAGDRLDLASQRDRYQYTQCPLSDLRKAIPRRPIVLQLRLFPLSNLTSIAGSAPSLLSTLA